MVTLPPLLSVSNLCLSLVKTAVIGLRSAQVIQDIPPSSRTLVSSAKTLLYEVKVALSRTGSDVFGGHYSFYRVVEGVNFFFPSKQESGKFFLENITG